MENLTSHGDHIAIDSNEVLGELGTLFLEGVTLNLFGLPFKIYRSSENREKGSLAITDEIRIPLMQLRSRPF